MTANGGNSDWRSQIQYHPGGLMRCCVESLHKDSTERKAPPKEGETLQCRYTSSTDHRMIFKDGAWRWDQS